jgi:steroid 5-alpha reductase family enzyme
MSQQDRNALIAFPIVVLLGVAIAWAGSQDGVDFLGLPLFAVCVGLAFVLQWLAFIPAYLFQTEKFYDLTGSVTYIAITCLALLANPQTDARALLIGFLVIVWAGRLGTFLFGRVLKQGKDDRFDELKPSFVRFLNTWTLQGLWITFTLAAGLAAITSANGRPIGWAAILGLALWLFGFTFEVISDWQKSRFRADPANQGDFIRTGLWSLSRHPNYFGEIVLWIGVAVLALPALHGWQYVTLISPVFVAVLIIRVSGIPLLEQKADKKWGGQPEYEAYKKETHILIPWL